MVHTSVVVGKYVSAFAVSLTICTVLGSALFGANTEVVQARIHTGAVCVAVGVRPLLLRGLVLSDSDAIRKLGAESLTPHQLACQEIAGAMMLLLPGLDANDQAKTERTIGFYLTVFSNCAAFTGLDLPREGDEAVIEFPMYISDFVTQLLEHLFGVIDALKGHVGGGVDTVDTCGLSSFCTMCTHAFYLPCCNMCIHNMCTVSYTHLTLPTKA